MGEAFITRRGGEFYELPVLNSSYPADVSIMESASASATFSVTIDTAGKPNEYVYQWYVNGAEVSGATSSSYTKTGLTSAATYTVYCTVTNKAGIVTSRTATLTVTSSKPTFTYNGSHSGIISDGGYNWKIKFYGTGTLKFTSLGNATSGIDVFLVGGGGGGQGVCSGGAGGGKTTTAKAVSVSTDTNYTITIGGGGSGAAVNSTGATSGGTTSAFGKSAAGGNPGTKNAAGGSGGSGGGGASPDSSDWEVGAGGYDGGNGGSGGNSNCTGGAGQGSTTREFAESGGTLYAGGGGGGRRYNSATVAAGGAGGGGNGGVEPADEYGNGQGPTNGTNNLGGGAGGGRAWYAGASGGSGIVVIRNKR